MGMSNLSVSIIVPVWGPPELTDACLTALNTTAPDVELVVIDNTGHYVLPDGVTVSRLLPQSENIGCTGAKILGVEKSSGEILITADCDTVAQPGWLEALLSAFDDPAIAMAGPRLIYPDGRLQCACIRTYHGGGTAGGANRQDEHPSNDEEDGCTGASMAIRRSVYLAVGGIDPLFRNAYDDVDLDLAVKEAGYKIGYREDSVVMHHESSTGPERWQFAAEAVTYMNQKWGNR
jgi:GT2 family glycosyltransferase